MSWLRQGLLSLLFAVGLLLPLGLDTGSASAVFCVETGETGTTPIEYEGDTCPDGKEKIVVDKCDDFNKKILGVPTWYKYLNGERVAGKCRPIISSASSALPIGLAVLEIGMTLGGLVAVVFVFVGSFKYVLSQGEPDKASNARKTVINAIVGLVIVIVATRVVSFIAKGLTS